MKQVRGWAFPDADDFMAAQMQADGSYQGPHLAMALRYVTDWTVAVDGGAHVGTWTRPMAARFGRVLAFEPYDNDQAALQANMAAFGCANVELHQAALGAAAGLVGWGLDQKALEMRNTGARYVVPDAGTTPQRTLDSLALPSLGFIKLDVEGSEPLALAGARETLARCKPVVLYENKNHWRRYGLPKDAVSDLLMRLGYQQLNVAGMDAIWGPRRR